MKKKILVLIILLLSYTNVYAITSNEVTYNNDTLTNKLDELMEELNMCKITGNAKADEILKGKTAYVKGTLITGTMKTLGAKTYTPGTSNQTIASGKYLSGAQTIKGDANLRPEVISCGMTIFGVTGTAGCNTIICKRATTLHTATCNGKCKYTGYSAGDTITYGQKEGESGKLTPGDAFDCDVNGDGTYDAATERFYYVSDYYNTETNTFDSNYATLIYYNNVSDGVANNNVVLAYDTENDTLQGPRAAIKELPKIAQWNNIRLKNVLRTIRNEKDGLTSKGGVTISNPFSYSGYAARLLTIQELNRACNITAGNHVSGEMNGCRYLNENTNYQDSSLLTGYWLETTTRGDGVWLTMYDYITDDYPGYDNMRTPIGVRPAIDVLKSNISY